MPKNFTKALIALGGNQKSVFGDVKETIQKAMVQVAQFSKGDVTHSALYRTPAFPAGAGPDFVNAAIVISTDQSAADILDHLHQIEAQADRTRTKRWGPRTLDLDLIGLGDQVLPDLQSYQAWRNLPLTDQQQRSPDRLILPHPRMHERAFVLVPLADVAPDWVHPVLGRTIQQMRDACPQSEIDNVCKL